jgi:hypothetical protein
MIVLLQLSQHKQAQKAAAGSKPGQQHQTATVAGPAAAASPATSNYTYKRQQASASI